MNLIVNGDPYPFTGTTVADLVAELQLTGRRLAVEVNREIVPKSEHGTHTLQEGDTIEVVHAIGGG
jgi:sulfur carrier protein